MQASPTPAPHQTAATERPEEESTRASVMLEHLATSMQGRAAARTREPVPAAAAPAAAAAPVAAAPAAAAPAARPTQVPEPAPTRVRAAAPVAARRLAPSN